MRICVLKMCRLAAVSRCAVACTLTIAIAVSVGDTAGVGWADPATDAVARVAELSREAERISEAVYAAELDLQAKVEAQRLAEDRQRAEAAAADVAQADLARYQIAVNQVAAAAYMGGSTSGISAVLTAQSPQLLIDELALKQTMAVEMSTSMAAFRAATGRADAAMQAAKNSTSQARTVAEQAAVVSAHLQAKQSELGQQIRAVEAQYQALTPDQRTALADPGPVPPVPPPSDAGVVAMPGNTLAEPSPPAGSDGVAVVQAALTRVGAPYSWGATGPDAFDCSGLIKWAFLQNGKSLPRSSQALAAGGQPVGVADLQPGDIITFYSDASHAGIYIGDGNMVHASTYGTPVKVAPISSAPIYNARRY